MKFWAENLLIGLAYLIAVFVIGCVVGLSLS